MKIDGFGGVIFWMRRVSEEHNKLALERLKRCGNLFFQATNFKTYPDEVKRDVLEHLIEDMKSFGWEDSVEEYFGETDSEPNSPQETPSGNRRNKDLANTKEDNIKSKHKELLDKDYVKEDIGVKP